MEVLSTCYDVIVLEDMNSTRLLHGLIIGGTSNGMEKRPKQMLLDFECMKCSSPK